MPAGNLPFGHNATPIDAFPWLKPCSGKPLGLVVGHCFTGTKAALVWAPAP
jgi:hypothetical protein